LNQVTFDLIATWQVVVTRPTLLLVRQGAGRWSLRVAKRLGIETVLLSISADWGEEAEIVGASARTLGMEARPVPLARRLSIERCRREWLPATRILSSSTYAADSLVRHGAHPYKITVLPRSSALSPGEIARPARADEHTRVLFVGQLAIRKGVHTLLLANRIVQARGRAQYTIEIIGPSVDPEYRAWLVKHADSNVEFRGKIPKPELREIYAAADVFVLPTLSDAFGMVVTEAQAAGLPVIVTDHCGAPVDDGWSGLVVPAGDPEALADALEKLVLDEAQRKRLGQNARDALMTWTWSDYRDYIGLWLRSPVSQREWRINVIASDLGTSHSAKSESAHAGRRRRQ
jgi:glycosyltransferase involved in cell wall biosynthesis